jgi:hypothetical protein
MMLPRVGLDPVMLQTLDITKNAEGAAPLAAGQANLERRMRSKVKSNSRNALGAGKIDNPIQE